MHRLSNLRPDSRWPGSRLHLKRSDIHMRDGTATKQCRRDVLLGEAAGQFAFDRFGNAVAIGGAETVQNQFLDVQFNVRLHTQPPVSASANDFSSLVNSF